MTTTGGGFISGRVTGPNDAGVPNVSVSVYDYDQKVISKRGLVSAVTDISGNYTIFSPLPPGSYKVQFSDGNPGNNNLIEWWDDKAGFSTADQFVVTAGGANKANCKLSEGGIITGTVTDGSNSPIQSASKAVYDQSQETLLLSIQMSPGLIQLSVCQPEIIK